ncbi:MAG: hypothetical protein Terrestrivirus8_14 [Terrestrivirus sp.]|uniref:Uncharacterized protein n=1 Tax=Terrestrivirus sp. TaxID=2487775 RepID=A0A3G4ZRA3_9VIRU|nr:MAG: hypothetical protein Terrestrivirus8_14 [Terrestrivirus sp.]
MEITYQILSIFVYGTIDEIKNFVSSKEFDISILNIRGDFWR